MAYKPRHQPHRADRLIAPGAKPGEIECDFVCGPFDRACRAADLKWGVDRLPQLVAPDMAAKYGRAVAALNASLDAGDPVAARQNADNCAKGLAALDAAATAAGAARADPAVWEYDLDGYRFAIIRDDAAWPALKAARPDLLFFTMRQVGNALKAYGLETAALDGTDQPALNAPAAPITPRRNWNELIGDDLPESMK